MPAQGKNRVILGLMTFGPDEDKGARVTDFDKFTSCLDYFHGEGYDEIDTARVYVGGKQEEWTAKADYKSRGFKLATKWYPNSPKAHEPEMLKAKCEESLAALKTDSVDIFYLHSADRTVPFQPTLKAINDLYEQGKFKTFAISNFTAAEVAEVCMICKYHDWVLPTLYQGMYNAITRTAEPELLVVLRRFGLDWVVYNPLAGGVLSGKMKSDEVPTEGRFSDKAGSGKMYRERYFKNATFEALKIIEPVIEKHNLTMIETALRWLVHHSALNLATRVKGGNDGIIIGVSSQAQLEGNLRDLEKGQLPEEVVQALDDAWKVCKGSAPNYWHGSYKYEYDTKEALFGEGAL